MKGTEQHRCPVRFTSHLSILRAVVGDATETQSQEGSCAASGASVAWVVTGVPGICSRCVHVDRMKLLHLLDFDYLV
uniref:Uncharacterized protein n=1 Tax=Spironucleus salmonicida TaxID=348837 RepID=V6LBP2_9EUKA|eukprot:EST41895.1 Hypothetical protein SS50377_18198 [Spironucleus salmonicida]